MNTPENAPNDSPFWRFSLRFYALPKVAPACIDLQDNGGADVNLMLVLLFLAESCLQVTRQDIARLDDAIGAWREEAVKPLRGLRRRLKEGIGGCPPGTVEGFRSQIKRMELEAERIEQHWLEREVKGTALQSAPSRVAAAHTNLAAYDAYLGRLPEEPLKIVLEAFTNTPP